MNQPRPKWVNTEPDAGAPHALLERVAQHVPTGTIEEIWLFPTRRIATGESTVVVVAAFEPDPDKRRVITARFTVTRDRKGAATVQEQLDEHGIAPASAVPRIINGVLHRMDEEGEQPPRTERIERDPERWWTLIQELGGTRPEPPADLEPQPESGVTGAPTDSEPGVVSEDNAADRSGGVIERAGESIDVENEIDYQ